ncbi:MAG: IS5 family transposase [Bacteroidota bacterium]
MAPTGEARSPATDAQWEVIAPRFTGRRPAKHHPRRILDALLYLARTGCQWRYLPDSYPPWQTVYYHLRQWIAKGWLTGTVHHLRRLVRRRADRDASPSAAIIDSPSVKTICHGSERGFDSGKRVKGRKRHILTDTLGLLLGVLVHEAGGNDSQYAPHLLDRVQGEVPRLEVIFADQGYRYTPAGLIWRVFGWLWRIVEREPGQRGFVVLQKRWVVERTFAWLGNYRRLSRDYEVLPAVSEAMIQLSAVRLMVRRLA